MTGKKVNVSVVACPTCGFRHRRAHTTATAKAFCCGVIIKLRCRHCPRFAVAILPAGADKIAHGVCGEHRDKYTEFAGAVALVASAIPDRDQCQGRKGLVNRRGGRGGDEPSAGQEDAAKRLED